jgi:hypothetical protein
MIFRDNMYKKTLAKFRDFQNHSTFPFLVGFGVVCLHLVITPILAASNYPTLSYLIGLILVAPSYFPVLAFGSQSPISKFVDSYVLDTFLIYLIPALFYGIVTGSLVSKNILLQLAAIALVVLLIIFACFLAAMAAQTFA